MATQRLFGVGFLPTSQDSAGKIVATATSTTLNTFTSAAAASTVCFNTEKFDLASEYDATTYTMTCASDGYYFIMAQSYLSTANDIYLEIYKGSTLLARNSNGTSTDDGILVQTMASCVAGDTITVKITNEGSTDAVLSSTDYHTQFVAFKLA